MLTNVCVWVKGVEYEDVVRLSDRLPQPIAEWDALVWRCWWETGWDYRPNSELSEQPIEIDAYYITGAMLEKLGISPHGPGIYILFVYHDAEAAAVASTVPVYTVDE